MMRRILASSGESIYDSPQVCALTNMIRISLFVPGTGFNMDLSDHGNAAPGTVSQRCYEVVIKGC